VPESRTRKKAVYTPPPPKTAKRKTSPPWIAPTAVSSMVFGLIWIVVYYATNQSFPGMHTLGAWNLIVGFLFIIAGLGLLTQWH
jgi:Cell division protein CrgA